MSKFLAALISVAIVASSFTSAAEAGPGRLGFFLGGMAAAAMIGHAAEDRRRDEAYERMRARQSIAARQQAAAAAAAAKRARLSALQRQRAATRLAANTPSTPATDTTAVLKKGDRLPSPDDASTPTGTAQTTTAIEKTSATNVVTKTASTADAGDAPTCRRYSAATDSLIDTPCQ